MSELSGGHYSPSEEFEIFSSWFEELWRQDKTYAEQIVSSIIAAEFGDVQLDKTE